jgi:hypothetical protein
MRLQTAWLSALSLVALTGCPEMHRRGGWADRAADKDAKARLEQRCTKAQIKKYCEDVESEECQDQCGD